MPLKVSFCLPTCQVSRRLCYDYARPTLRLRSAYATSALNGATSGNLTSTYTLQPRYDYAVYLAIIRQLVRSSILICRKCCRNDCFQQIQISFLYIKNVYIKTKLIKKVNFKHKPSIYPFLLTW